MNRPPSTVVGTCFKTSLKITVSFCCPKGLPMELLRVMEVHVACEDSRKEQQRWLYSVASYSYCSSFHRKSTNNRLQSSTWMPVSGKRSRDIHFHEAIEKCLGSGICETNTWNTCKWNWNPRFSEWTSLFHPFPKQMSAGHQQCRISFRYDVWQWWNLTHRLLSLAAPVRCCFGMITLSKLNIAPEKWWLEDYFPIGKVTFQGLC